jgi:hypothetical protein
MGVLTSSVVAKTYKQCLENNELHKLLIKYQMMGYVRYIDDTLIIFDTRTTHINNMLTEFNTLHPSVTFTLELKSTIN